MQFSFITRSRPSFCYSKWKVHSFRLDKIALFAFAVHPQKLSYQACPHPTHTHASNSMESRALLRRELMYFGISAYKYIIIIHLFVYMRKRQWILGKVFIANTMARLVNGNRDESASYVNLSSESWDLRPKSLPLSSPHQIWLLDWQHNNITSDKPSTWSTFRHRDWHSSSHETRENPPRPCDKSTQPFPPENFHHHHHPHG